MANEPIAIRFRQLKEKYISALRNETWRDCLGGALETGTISPLGCYLFVMPKDIIELDAVQTALIKLEKAKRCVAVLGSLLAEIPPSTDAHAEVLSWLKFWERFVFSRRLELDMLWKERRRSDPERDRIISKKSARLPQA